MPFDITAANRQAVQSGLALGQAMFNNSLRMQQLESQKAMQQLQQQHLAQQMQYATEAHDLAAQERADMEKAMARVQLESVKDMPGPLQPIEMVPGGPETNEGRIANPNFRPLDQSLMTHVLPVIAKYRPQEADNFIANVAMLPYRQAMAQKATLGGATTPGYLQKNIDTINNDPDLTPEEKKLAIQRQLHLVANPAADTTANQKLTLQRQEKMALLNEVFKNEATDLLSFDENGAPFLTPEAKEQLKARGTIPGPMRNKELEKTAKIEDMVSLGKRLLPLINNETVGAKGEITRLAQRYGLTMIIPALRNPKVSEADAAGQEFTSGVIMSLRSDSNISEREANILRGIAATIRWTTPEESKAKVAEFLANGLQKARDSFTRIKQPIPDKFITIEEIRDRVGKGKLSVQDALDLTSNSLAGLVLQARMEAGLE